MALSNVWHLRKVAEASSKPCDICYKPTTGVLITPDHKDYFYICQGHLKDRGFATPIAEDGEAAAKKRKEQMDREIESVKREYEEKMKKKTKLKEEKEKDIGEIKDKQKEENKAKANEEIDDDAGAEKDKNEKITSITKKQTLAPVDEEPRIYALQK